MTDLNTLLEDYIDNLPLGSNFSAYVDGDFIRFTYTDKYEKFGPVMYARCELDGDYCYFWPVISMPECDSEDLDYADSFMYLADAYADACKIATYMLKYPMVLD